MKKKILILFGFIFFCIFILIGYFTFYDLQQEKILKEEVKKIEKMDITKDRYNTKILSSGDYGVVEECIKKYLDSYAVSLQDVLNIINDKKLIGLLSADNYASDGPEFVNSFLYIEQIKDRFNKNINKLINMCSEDSILSYIEKKNLSSYYVDLYKKLMFTDGMSKDFSDSRILLQDSKDSINNLLVNTENVLNYLVSTKGDWIIENGEILFSNEEMVSEYNSLISKVKSN